MEDRLVGNRYKIVKKIGSGGMADVYLAVDRVLGRDVAVKILHKQFANDPEFVERFKREAQSAANLNHPNIVSIYDRGQFDGTFYIAMELLQGENLKDIILREAPMPANKVTDIAIQICSALQFAHKNGVIHRDIKPQNIIITDDNIKVTDFGIARAASDSQVTRTGTILGTAHYLSPEQAHGHQVVEQSDLYSLGVVLYEMATGLLPFKGENPIAVALKHINVEPAPPRQVIGTIPEGLEAIILKALEKDQGQRYASASDMKNDLELLREGVSPVALSEAETGLMTTQVLRSGRGVDLTALPGKGKREEERKKKRRKVWLWLVPLLVLIIGLAAAAFAYFELSKQPSTNLLPTVVGRSFDSAQKILKSGGFRPKLRAKVFSDQYPPDFVVKQDPAGGENVKNGSVVYLWLSKGKQQIAVPELIGLSEDEAVAEIEKLGLKVGPVTEEFSNRYGSGEVSDQVPGAGELVKRNSSVSLVVSKGTERISVPSLVGLTDEKAVAQLGSKGFDVRKVYDFSPKYPSGSVMDQNPSAGSMLSRGSDVTITISKGSQKVSVPGVIGFTESAAKSQISSVGLEATVDYKESTSAPEGTVISQSPEGGSQIIPGSVVTIVIAQAPPPHEGTTTSP